MTRVRSNFYFALFMGIALLMAAPAPTFLLAPSHTQKFIDSWDGAIVVLFLWEVTSVVWGSYFLYQCGLKKALLYFLISLVTLEILAIRLFTIQVLLNNPLAELALFVCSIPLAGALSIPFDYLDTFKDENLR